MTQESKKEKGDNQSIHREASDQEVRAIEEGAYRAEEMMRAAFNDTKAPSESRI